MHKKNTSKQLSPPLPNALLQPYRKYQTNKTLLKPNVYWTKVKDCFGTTNSLLEFTDSAYFCTTNSFLEFTDSAYFSTKNSNILVIRNYVGLPDFPWRQPEFCDTHVFSLVPLQARIMPWLHQDNVRVQSLHFFILWMQKIQGQNSMQINFHLIQFRQFFHSKDAGNYQIK